jgi:hypothetical protein
MIVFVVVFCIAVYSFRGIVRAFLSPEFTRDVERLREQRRRRREARRGW